MQRSVLLVLAGIVQPAAFLAMTLLARRRGSHVDPGALALGMALVGLWSTTIWQTGMVVRDERWYGTLPAVLSRPTSFALVLAGKAAGSTLRSTLFVVPTVVAVSVISGESIPVRHPAALAAAAAAVLVSASVFGMLVGCLFVLTRSATRIAEAVTYPVFVLGGLVIPLSLLPHWLRPLSAVVSLRWGADLLRAASDGTGQSGHAWLLLAATTALYAAAAALLFNRMVDHGRRAGTLEFF